MSFATAWINLIRRCISSVSYSVLINGKIGNDFKPSRGLRQGDPLSPFLFLLYGEGLSILMNKALNEGLLKGAKASRSGPPITHLLFADDCLLFGEATERAGSCFEIDIERIC